MTEEEAKTRWCPFALTHAHKYDTATREVNNDLCIASACMAWRWGDIEFSADGERRDTWPELAKYGPADQRLKRHGYCGLAGRP